MALLGLVIPYFEARDYPLRRTNLSRCVDCIKDEGLENWLIVECLFDGNESRLPDYGEHHITLHGDVMWQKERLVWIGFSRLMDSCDNLAMCDADTVFDTHGWSERIESALQKYAAVQNCSIYHQKFFDIDRSGHSAMYHYLKTGQMVSKRCGGSWSFRRDLLRETQILQYCIVGGGDNPWSYAAVDPKLIVNSTLYRYYSNSFRKLLVDWVQRFHDTAKQLGGLGCVEQTATTLAHGTLEGRDYCNRHKGMMCYEPRDVVALPGQPFFWATDKPALHKYVRNYLEGRD